ncbi:hypothetical protein RJ639_014087 [Escallonia herrerae]|uniref:RING-type E3 ubiquitin transferase n=1 Tax=Escallonia herrerae TaxID=1293975 RepID=A0AA88VJA3_9ASTE|nr:hypothetical protein RJ639_014087 [Escallonia herrerae]
MAHANNLPCDGDGACMVCKATPPSEELLTCVTCATPWHVACLATPPETLASTLRWECPDCSTLAAEGGGPAAAAAVGGGELVAAIKAIEADSSLTERQKARRRQELVSGRAVADKGKEKVEEDNAGNDILALLGENFKCSFCMQLPERPITTPCGHNFCLKCFEKWIGQRKRTCAKCRRTIPPKMASNPRINSALVAAIRMAKISKTIANGRPQRVYHVVHDQNRPEKAFTTDRAVKNGLANASCGRILVTTPKDHFGPIPAENDPERNQGVLVGETWTDRLECRQWGVHNPMVAGIAGQQHHGAQSVVLSGGYQDDEDHGEWFLYTGSGGRDLTGNKRTNKHQSSDQKFQSYNEALRVSCKKGYPVRVVRSNKEKRSSYAPETGLRYDGVYRIEKCWQKVGIQGFKVCRYLFVRCDNEPAPWTSDEYGDRPRPLPVISELKKATELFERTESPSWDYDEEEACWKWKKPPPATSSKLRVTTGDPDDRKRVRTVIRKTQYASVKVQLLKGFSCLICKKVMTLPLTTPCAHNFCKACLEGKFSGQTFVKERMCQGGRKLRAHKNVMECPACTHDISEFLQDPQVNRELMDVIEKLQQGDEEDADTMEDIDEEGDASDPLSVSDEHKMPDHQAEEKNAGADDANLPKEQPKRSYKRRKVVAEDGLSKVEDVKEKMTAGTNKKAAGGARRGTPRSVAKAKSKKAEEAADEGNVSPSSPLHLRSDED